MSLSAPQKEYHLLEEEIGRNYSLSPVGQQIRRQIFQVPFQETGDKKGFLQ